MNVSKIKLRIRRNSKARPLRKLTWLDVRLCLFVFFCQTFYKHWRRRWLASWQAGWLCDWLWFLSSSLLLLSLIVGHLLFHNIYRSVSQSAVPFSHDSWFIGFFKFLRANKLPSVFLLLKLLENIHSLLDRSFSSVSQACSSPSVLKCRNYYWPKDIGHDDQSAVLPWNVEKTLFGKKPLELYTSHHLFHRHFLCSTIQLEVQAEVHSGFLLLFCSLCSLYSNTFLKKLSSDLSNRNP